MDHNALNSFAVISFNINDLNPSFEYLDIFSTEEPNHSEEPLLSNRSIQADEIIEDRQIATREVEEPSYYWVVNTGEEFLVSSMPMRNDSFDDIFAGPFMSEYLAKRFINEIKNYMHDGI